MRRWLSCLALAAVGLTWGSLTAARVHVFADPARVWQDATRVSPEKPRAWINLGIVYAMREQTGRAEAAYMRAISLSLQSSPRSVFEQTLSRGLAEGNLAVLRFNRGDRAGALALTRSVLSRHPTPTAVAQFQTWVLASSSLR